MSFDLNEANAVVTQFIFKEIPDGLQKANYLWYLLATKNKEYIDGGKFIQFAIKALANQSQGFINGSTDVIDMNVNQQLVYGTLNWKYHYSNVSITLDDLTKTSDTPRAIKSLLEAKKQMGKADAIRQLSAAVHNSSTVNPKSFDGLVDAISSGAYAGLTPGDFTDNAYLPIVDTATTVVSYSNIAPMITRLRARAQNAGGASVNGKVDLMLSNDAVYQAFMNSQQGNQRFVEVSDLAAGFEGVKVNGVSWFVDSNAAGSGDGVTADNYLYVLTSDTLRMAYKYGLDNKSPLDGVVRIPNQPINGTQAFFAGNLVVDNRRLNGVFQTLVA